MARKLRKRPKTTTGRKGSSLDGEAIVPVPLSKARARFYLEAQEVRRQAAHDFISDPEARTVRFWWERTDRPYRRLVAFDTFQDWATDDDWIARRDRFWQEIEYRVLENTKHQVLQQRIKEINELTIATDAMSEYLRPLTHEDGSVQRHEDGPLKGLPIFPLEIPPMDKFGKTWIEMHKLLMTKRGEVTSRSEDTKRDGEDGSALDPVTQGVPFSRTDIRALAKYALQMKQPELQGDVIEVLRELGDDDDAAKEETVDAEEEDSNG